MPGSNSSPFQECCQLAGHKVSQILLCSGGDHPVFSRVVKMSGGKLPVAYPGEMPVGAAREPLPLPTQPVTPLPCCQTIYHRPRSHHACFLSMAGIRVQRSNRGVSTEERACRAGVASELVAAFGHCPVGGEDILDDSKVGPLLAGEVFEEADGLGSRGGVGLGAN